MKTRLLTTILALMPALAGMGAPSVALYPTSVYPGEKTSLTVSLDTDGESVTSLQFDLDLPSWAVAGDATLDNTLTNTHQAVTARMVGGALRVMVYSATNATISDGTLVTLPIAVGESVMAGDYTVNAHDIIIVSPEAVSWNQEDSSTTITIKEQPIVEVAELSCTLSLDGEDLEVTKSGVVTLSVDPADSPHPVAVQIDLIADDLTLSDFTLNADLISTHKFSIGDVDGKTRVIIYSMTNATIDVADLLSFIVTAPDVEGMASVVTSGGLMVDAQMLSYPLPDSTLSIEVKGSSKVESIDVEPNTTLNVWYNLQGQRLANPPTTPGVYITNGNKVLIK
ncbi:MAG: hypothetical protein LIP02_10125 [Bacteroidales bacterium]|nr:hypothetical protein [Bacteroidales bacterium]